MIDFIARAVALVPQVIPYLKSGFYKTYDYMLATIQRMVQSVYNGNMGGDFVDVLGNLITGQLTQAYQQALEDSGSTANFLPDYLQSDLTALINEQVNFDWIYQYYKDIVDARVDRTSIDPLLSRANLWANQYNAAYNRAELLINTENGGRLIWRKGNTEHGCETCASLDGIVAFASEWESLGVHPQGYPNDKLDCQGGGPGNYCDCSLSPTDQRRSPKAYDTIMNIVSR